MQEFQTGAVNNFAKIAQRKTPFIVKCGYFKNRGNMILYLYKIAFSNSFIAQIAWKIVKKRDILKNKKKKPVRRLAA